MGILPVHLKTLVAYKRSTYRAGPVCTRIGAKPQAMGTFQAGRTRDEWVMLSAYNPGGILKAEGWNKRMFASLERDLQKKHIRYFRGEGRLHHTGEPLYMVRSPLRVAVQLARKYRQNAVVIIKPRQKSRLLLLA